MTIRRTGIALGSNLGDRLAHLQAATRLLLELHEKTEPFLDSRIYQTEPRFCPPDSPVFLNAVVELAWAGSATELHRRTLEIESAIGRGRSDVPNAPRIIDVDILYLGDERVLTDSLELPHPRITQRRFVLEPLADIDPHLRLPGWNATVSSILGGLQTDEAPAMAVPGRLLD